MRTTSADLIFDARATLGEGAIWDSRNQALLWIDILGKKFWRTTEAHTAFEVGQFVGTIVPRQRGGVALALHRGFAFYDLATQKLTPICDPEDNRPELRFNDGKCDPAGRFWAGTMPVGDGGPIGSLFCLDADLHVDRKVTEVSCSNGIAWSLDHKTLYYIDTPLQRVDAFDYDVATGFITNRRVAITVPKAFGYPDGSTIDADGMLWIAHWDGSRVTQWDPRTGKLLQTIPLPVSRVTSCAFGGPRLDRLYITSAAIGTKPDEKHAGGLFCVDAGVKGVPAYEFLG